jgi:hypothetical protein
MKPLYVSATLKDSGKTSIILGLMQCFNNSGRDVGYIKPVGQRYVEYEGANVDEDTVLVREVLGLKDTPVDMSPIAIERNFTREFIQNPDSGPLEEKIAKSLNNITANHKSLLIEGTGHAGVGSCFSLSNARVAELMNANVIIITKGGIGRPIDEIALSLSLFQRHNVNVLGIVLNKVLPEKLDMIREITSKGFENLGTRLLGAIPYEPEMSFYTVKQIAEEFDYEILSGEHKIENHIEHTVVAAMEPQNALQYIRPHSMIITPGDRIDNILLTLTLSGSKRYSDLFRSGGLILTGGLQPEKTILDLLKKSKIPVLLTEDDTYAVTARMKDLAFKIRPLDTYKIQTAEKLVKTYIDWENLFTE